MDPHQSTVSPSFPQEGQQSTLFFPQYQTPSGIFLGSSANYSQPFGSFSQSYIPGHPLPRHSYEAPPSFVFRERKGRVNWRNLSNLDVDQLIQSGDVRALEEQLSNITFTAIEKEDIERIGDATLLKIFRLSQYGLEYLLNSQNNLANQSVILDHRYRSTQEKLGPLEEQAKKNHDEIAALKSEVKQKRDVLDAYKNTLSVPIFKCHMCPKYFKSQDYLEAHFHRRHPVSTESKTQPLGAIEPVAKIQKLVVKDESTSPLSRKDTAKNEQNDFSNFKNATISTNADTMSNFQNSQVLEKLISQLKEEEDSRLSGLSVIINEQLQNLARSNKDLASKISTLEQKLDSQAQENVSIRRGRKRSEEDLPEEEEVFTRRRSSRRTSPVPIEVEVKITRQEDSPDIKQSAPETATFGSPDTEKTLVKDALEENVEEIQRKETPKRLAKEQGIVFDSQERDESQTNGALRKTLKKQEFNVSSLKDLNDTDPKAVVYDKELNNMEAKSTAKKSQERLVSPKIEKLDKVKKEHEKQVFHTQDMMDDDKSEVHANNPEVKESEQIVAWPSEKGSPETEKKIEQAINLGEESEEEKQDDQNIKERRRSLMKKAIEIDNNKYHKKVTKDQENQAREKMNAEINGLCKKIFGVEYKKLGDKNIDELSEVRTSLQKMNKQQDYEYAEDMIAEYKEVGKFRKQSPAKKPLKKQEQSPEKSAKKEEDSHKNNTNPAPVQFKKTELMKSGELLTLLVSDDKDEGKYSPVSREKNLRDSLNQKSTGGLEKHLISTEDLRKDVGSQGLVDSSSDPNLVKKSIESAVPEQI